MRFQFQKVQIGSQKKVLRIQDTLSMKEVTHEKLDGTNCANCKHNVLLPHGLDQHKTNHRNDRVMNQYRAKILISNQLSSSTKGPKLKVGKVTLQKLMCLCTQIYYLNHVEVNSCLKCKWACTKARKVDSSTRPYFDDNMNCICLVCVYQ